eukprot:SAG31_NODE_34_length_31842_cov_31.677850_25_plen_46_part_00
MKGAAGRRHRPVPKMRAVATIVDAATIQGLLNLVQQDVSRAPGVT